MEKHNKRHAYLILAHKNQQQLELLLKLLDIEQNDIFIHIDSRAKDISFTDLKKAVNRTKVFFTDRTSVSWGSYSIVNSTLVLLKAAKKEGPYSYYHLLSGQDLPLKPIAEINKFYDENDNKWNYLNMNTEDNEWSQTAVAARLDYFSKWNKKMSTGGKFAILTQPLRRIIYIIKRRLTKYIAGAAWFDINDELASLILKKEKWIYRRFKNFLLPDEAFLQTIVYKYGLEKTCKPYMRYIDWDNSGDGKSPYVFREHDFQRLVSSGCNFARKFDMDVDDVIVKKMYQYILNL